jgi:hypothetical protein
LASSPRCTQQKKENGSWCGWWKENQTERKTHFSLLPHKWPCQDLAGLRPIVKDVQPTPTQTTPVSPKLENDGSRWTHRLTTLGRDEWARSGPRCAGNSFRVRSEWPSRPKRRGEFCGQ